MANIIYTNKCNIQCPYCFATENNLSEKSNSLKNYSIGDLWRLGRFITTNQFRFCGGEPTQNPNIIESIDLLLRNNKSMILLMTNGLWGNEFQEYISQLHPNSVVRINYLFNILPPDFYNKKQIKTLNSVLSIVNPTNSTLGLTIYKKQIEYKYLFDLAKKYRISNIRWSVTAPNLSSGEYTLEKDFKIIADKLVDFYREGKQDNLTINQDCGYIPLCYFEKEELFELNFEHKTSMKFGCYSAPIDLDNNKAWRCYGLFSLLNKNISEFSDEDKLRKYFDLRTKFLNKLYLYSECVECKYYMNSCGGGCLTIRIKKALKDNPDLCLFPIDNDIEILKCKPKIRNTTTIKEINDIQYLFGISRVNRKPDENTVGFLSEIDNDKTINDLIEIWKCNFSSYENAKREIIDMCRSSYEKELIDLDYDYDVDFESNSSLVRR